MQGNHRFAPSKDHSYSLGHLNKRQKHRNESSCLCSGLGISFPSTHPTDGAVEIISKTHGIGTEKDKRESSQSSQFLRVRRSYKHESKRAVSYQISFHEF